MLTNDDELIAYLAAHPGKSLARICEGLLAKRPRYRNGNTGYTPQAKALAQQLQRLRRARRVRYEHGGWRVWGT
jgi:hypothetical protein